MPQSITLGQKLPQFMKSLQQIAKDSQAAKFKGWQDFTLACDDIYTPQMMKDIETVAPGWQKMASYAERQTLIHVTAVLTSLLLLEEYRNATLQQQILMEWIVLFHDIAKRAHPHKRDHTHGFRSAAITAKALPALGFAMKNDDSELFEKCFQLIHSSEIYSDTHDDMIQDNSKLPSIIDSIDRLFGEEAALILKGVLFHMSINVLREWPNAAPLNDDEIKRYITPELLPLLRAMMLVDNDAWSFFEPELKAAQKQETRMVFGRIAAMMKAPLE